MHSQGIELLAQKVRKYTSIYDKKRLHNKCYSSYFLLNSFFYLKK